MQHHDPYVERRHQKVQREGEKAARTEQVVDEQLQNLSGEVKAAGVRQAGSDPEELGVCGQARIALERLG